MRFPLCAFAALLSVTSLAAQAPAASAPAQTPPKPEDRPIHWQHGPTIAKIGTVAQIKVPKGYEFADGEGSRMLLERFGNPTSGSELGVLTPESDAKADSWCVFFDFSNTGHVNDDDKDALNDPQSLLDSMKAGTEQDNIERKKRGWTPFHILRWETRPFYDTKTRNLTWSSVGYDDNEGHPETLNYETRLLGRDGVMNVDLMMDKTQPQAIPALNDLLTGFTFNNGARYDDFRAGDKLAEYGLGALIVGGATAVAVKTGFFAKLVGLLAAGWKAIAVAFAALLTRVKKIWASLRSRFSRKRESDHWHDRE